jgi:hypothetical protein
MLGLLCLSFLSTALSSASFDGFIGITGSNHQIGYHLLPFSNLDYPPLPQNYTIIREGDFCDPSNIIGPNSSIAAIINHGECNIFIEAQNLLNVGYKYVIIANFDYNSWISDEVAINQLIVTLPDSFHHLIGHNDANSKTIEIAFQPHNFSQFICICETQAKDLFKKNFLTNLYSTSRSCISSAIAHMEKEGRTYHTVDEMSVAISLAKLLWTNNLHDETQLLLKWIAMTFVSNELIYLKIYSQQISSLTLALQELISILYQIGEWKLAEVIMTLQTSQLCKPSTLNLAVSTDLCSQICGLSFVTVFGTLQSQIATNPSNQRMEQVPMFSDDWTISSSNERQTKPPTKTKELLSSSLSSLPLSHCFQHFETRLTAENESIDQLNTFLLQKFSSYKDHPVLWLSTNELSYLSKKYGALNVISFLRHSIGAHRVDHYSKSSNRAALTSHLTEYSQLFSHQVQCSRTIPFELKTNSSWFDCSILRREPSIVRLEHMPLVSQSTLKKNIKLGRNKKKAGEILNSALMSHLIRDMVEVHSRLSVYWDEYGAFHTSQRHALSRVHILLCQKLTDKSVEVSNCLSEEDGFSLSCLFERHTIATPMIFGSSDEFQFYRTQQIASLSSMHSIISEYSQRENLSNSLEVVSDRKKLISSETQITSTPPSMMIGYQYEMQDMGDRALAPAASVLPSSFDLLEKRHQNELLCHSAHLLDHEISYRPQLIRDSTTRPLNSKIRIGFISRFFYEHSVGRLINGIITQLSSLKFEKFVFCLCCGHQSEEDSLQRNMRATHHLTWVDIQSNRSRSQFHCAYELLSNHQELHNEISRVQSFDLDLILYPELGMDSLTIHFASKRLASIQAVYWGHPISQSLPTIDYFISSQLFDFHNPRCQFPR